MSITLPADGRLNTLAVDFAAQLHRHGRRPALITDQGTLSYEQLAAKVAEVGERLGTVRRLLLLEAENTIDAVIAYLAALAGGHPLMLVPADKPAASESLRRIFEPDVVLSTGSGAGEPRIQELRSGTVHDLHPDLALLLSTSGSTGSPKLVRLSHENVQANAESIAEYLNLSQEDRAITALPMSYCYGLSVINSHLLRGAALVLTDTSVVDPCFWELFKRHEATSFAAVPYTFDLLERVNFEGMELPSLRYVTQAGGRLAPPLVRRYAQLGERQGWELFVMYGQTEATARMAYLPPKLAQQHPGRIGVPIPGGRFRIEAVEGLEHGELVYAGPNVMLGYALAPADLAQGRTITELRTGDLARQHADGLFEVVGRRSRFIKIAGLRLDLGRIEQLLDELGVTALAAGTDDKLVIAVPQEHDAGLLKKMLASDLGIPRGALQIAAVPELPRLENGKPDYRAVLDLAQSSAPLSAAPTQADQARRGVREIFAVHLEVPVVGDGDSFVSLGGDSLSYVAVSVSLEDALGALPQDWHLRTVAELEQLERSGRAAPRWRKLFAPMESSIVLRAVGIVLIVGTHIGLFHWEGSAHLLLAVAGYNFARFQLGGQGLKRLRRQIESISRIVLPSVAFIAVGYLFTDHYSVANLFLLNALIGPQEVTTQWHFWFVEVITYLLVCMSLLLAIPAIGRLQRRIPMVYPLALTAFGLASRFQLIDLEVPNSGPALWLFAMGWAIAAARGRWQRLALSLLAVLSIPGCFNDPSRESTVLVGVLVLIWVRSIPVPLGLQKAVAWLASASLFIYLTHWLVYPPLLQLHPVAALVGSLAAGVLYWALVMFIMGRLRRRVHGQDRGNSSALLRQG
ncbi:AMP-dependent synthetase [Glutamicibacter uratoxydans]|uniref:AMP-dependent synthetase n=1 Tax=Glutamicibacter uratoxydans TaxID=43667 RepID=A0A4Y4DNZ3_GLUUR|nr:AMP-binding protein [Glutamicibacter uratoxydans]GED06327.1 AMP-dependent synthetase [Glutamicibacter uratoxydans]